MPSFFWTDLVDYRGIASESQFKMTYLISVDTIPFIASYYCFVFLNAFWMFYCSGLRAMYGIFGITYIQGEPF